MPTRREAFKFIGATLALGITGCTEGAVSTSINITPEHDLPSVVRKIGQVRMRQVGNVLRISAPDRIRRRAVSDLAEICDAYGKPSTDPSPESAILYVNDPECPKSEEVKKRLRRMQS